MAVAVQTDFQENRQREEEAVVGKWSLVLFALGPKPPVEGDKLDSRVRGTNHSPGNTSSGEADCL